MIILYANLLFLKNCVIARYNRLVNLCTRQEFDYMTIIEQLDGKENEIEELKAELNHLSEQIALSNAKEEEYLNSARSCVSLENQIQMLQQRLADHRRDFEKLSTVHAACPTPQVKFICHLTEIYLKILDEYLIM